MQTEIATDSHRTICANDMFQTVSLQYAELLCPRASRMYNCFYLFKSLGLSHRDCGAKLLSQRNPTGNPGAAPSFRLTVTCLQYLLFFFFFFYNVLFALAPIFIYTHAHTRKKFIITDSITFFVLIKKSSNFPCIVS